MINVYVLTHGEFGKYLINTAEMIVGDKPYIKSYSLLQNMSVDSFKQILEQDVDKDGYNLFLVDVLAGSPFNSIIPYMKLENTECITGVNLPMLLEVLINRENMTLDELVNAAKEVGTQGIKSKKQILMATFDCK